MNAPHDLPVKPMRAKRCKAPSCRQVFTPARPLQVACSPLCAIELIAKAKAKKHEAAMKAERKALREKRERLKTLTEWLDEAQRAVNAFVRARDAGKPCISCGRYHTGKWNAGHYLSRGARPELRFHEDNIHLQCEPCNSYKAGNATAYRINLLAKIGPERLAWLEGPHQPARYRIEDAKAIKATYQQKLKELTR